MTSLEKLKLRYPGAETYRFGDSPALSDSLLALVRTGRKRATCTAMAEIGVSEALPPDRALRYRVGLFRCSSTGKQDDGAKDIPVLRYT